MAARRSGWSGCCGSIFLQPWFNLSDPAVEEAPYDSRAMRGFVRIDLGREPVPDATTVCRFRHLLETHELGQQLFAEVRRHLAANGLNLTSPIRPMVWQFSPGK
jgi:transposase, IS5 family